MAPQIDVQSLIDIGLIVLVTLACAKSFFHDTGSGDSRRAAWKAELKDLESTLRELIGEAGAASRNLDRNLLARKRELESLLGQLDTHELTAGDVPLASEQSESTEDLPNASWAESSAPKSTPKCAKSRPAKSSPKPKKQANPPAYTRAGAANASTAAENPIDGVGLEKLIEKADDTLTLSQQVTKEVLRQQAEKRKDQNSGAGTTTLLAQKLAEAKQENELDPLEQATFQGTSIMDQATYRITRRLLLSGKELHVVARKVDLPVSEIRLLDRLIRDEEKRREDTESGGEDAEFERLESLSDQIETLADTTAALPGEGTFSPASPTVSDVRLPTAAVLPAAFVNEFEPGAIPVAGAAARNLDRDIEREIALL